MAYQLNQSNDDEQAPFLNQHQGAVHVNNDQNRRFWQIFSLVASVVIVGSVALATNSNEFYHPRSHVAKARLAAIAKRESSTTTAPVTIQTEISEAPASTSKLVVRTTDTVVPVYGEMSSEDHKGLFLNFKTKYSKLYESEAEEASRYEAFKATLVRIDERNAAEALVGGRASHGITKFADNTVDEIKAMLGARNLEYKSLDTKGIESADSSYHIRKTDATVQNWAGIYTTPVKNQGYCGSCWAFSATEQIESDAMREGILTKYDYLSEQQIVDCDKADFGCGGGSTETAYVYISTNGGLESASDYPYVSKDGESTSCTSDSADFKVTVDRFQHIYEEDNMVNYVLSTGPLSVCLDASSWDSYENGIVHDCGDSVDHCVQVVGVNTQQKYWIVRNSWGTDWGVDGYIYLNLYNNTCDITNDPSYTVVSAVSN